MPKTPVPISPLARFVTSIKSTDKSLRNPAERLLAIIDAYTLTGEFDKYITQHADDVARYLKPDTVRPGRWRASAAGKCVQQQVFAAAQKLMPGRVDCPAAIKRKAETHRALNYGTLFHVGKHLLFDALHERGDVTTLYAEDLRYDKATQMSGTVDRVIEFPFDGTTVRAILDFKSMKSLYFDVLLEPTPEHTMQLTAYSLFGYEADWYILLYENKDTHRLKIYARRFDDVIVQAVIDNLRKMNNWIDLLLVGAINDQLPHMPLITTWCNWCEYNAPCKKLNPDRDGKVVH